jgi:hypothetical protein
MAGAPCPAISFRAGTGRHPLPPAITGITAITGPKVGMRHRASGPPDLVPDEHVDEEAAQAAAAQCDAGARRCLEVDLHVPTRPSDPVCPVPGQGTVPALTQFR